MERLCHGNYNGKYSYINDFGKGMHVFQDSFSHEGFGSEHVGVGHAPDQYWRNKNSLAKATQMAEETYRLLKNFKEARGENAAEWSEIKDEVNQRFEQVYNLTHMLEYEVDDNKEHEINKENQYIRFKNKGKLRYRYDRKNKQWQQYSPNDGWEDIDNPFPGESIEDIFWDFDWYWYASPDPTYILNINHIFY